MYCQDLEFEELVVPEPIGLAFDRLDLVEDPPVQDVAFEGTGIVPARVRGADLDLADGAAA
jgi:hypothetical protein